MRKLILFAAGTAAAAATAAFAAAPQKHMMNVALPDGAVAHIEYSGNIAPKVSVDSRPLAGLDAAFGSRWAPIAIPSFAGVDRMIEQMNRESEAMLRQAHSMARNAPAAPGAAPFVASWGKLPAGAESTSVVTYSNGAGSCTRTTEVQSLGAGKPPKVTSSVSGDCASAPAGQPGAANPSSAPINHT